MGCASSSARCCCAANQYIAPLDDEASSQHHTIEHGRSSLTQAEDPQDQPHKPLQQGSANGFAVDSSSSTNVLLFTALKSNVTVMPASSAKQGWAGASAGPGPGSAEAESGIASTGLTYDLVPASDAGMPSQAQAAPGALLHCLSEQHMQQGLGSRAMPSSPSEQPRQHHLTAIRDAPAIADAAAAAHGVGAAQGAAAASMQQQAGAAAEEAPSGAVPPPSQQQQQASAGVPAVGPGGSDGGPGAMLQGLCMPLGMPSFFRNSVGMSNKSLQRTLQAHLYAKGYGSVIGRPAAGLVTTQSMSTQLSTGAPHGVLHNRQHAMGGSMVHLGGGPGALLHAPGPAATHDPTLPAGTAASPDLTISSRLSPRDITSPWAAVGAGTVAAVERRSIASALGYPQLSTTLEGWASALDFGGTEGGFGDWQEEGDEDEDFMNIWTTYSPPSSVLFSPQMHRHRHLAQQQHLVDGAATAATAPPAPGAAPSTPKCAPLAGAAAAAGAGGLLSPQPQQSGALSSSSFGPQAPRLQSGAAAAVAGSVPRPGGRAWAASVHLAQASVAVEDLAHTGGRTDEVHPAVAAFKQGTLGFAFSGGGFFFPYHLGVVTQLHDMGILTDATRVVGASCGSIIAACVSSGLDLHGLVSKLQDFVTDCRMFGTPGRLRHVIEKFMTANLPADAHLRCRDRCYITLTKVFPYMRPVIVGDWQSKEDLVQGIATSCHIPAYNDGSFMARFRNQWWVDGGLLRHIPTLPPEAGATYVAGISCVPLKFLDALPGVSRLQLLHSLSVSPDMFGTFPFNWHEVGGMVLAPAEDPVLLKMIHMGKNDILSWANAVGLTAYISRAYALPRMPAPAMPAAPRPASSASSMVSALSANTLVSPISGTHALPSASAAYALGASEFVRLHSLRAGLAPSHVVHAHAQQQQHALLAGGGVSGLVVPCPAHTVVELQRLQMAPPMHDLTLQPPATPRHAAGSLQPQPPGAAPVSLASRGAALPSPLEAPAGFPRLSRLAHASHPWSDSGVAHLPRSSRAAVARGGRRAAGGKVQRNKSEDWHDIEERQHGTLEQALGALSGTGMLGLPVQNAVQQQQQQQPGAAPVSLAGRGAAPPLPLVAPVGIPRLSRLAHASHPCSDSGVAHWPRLSGAAVARGGGREAAWREAGGWDQRNEPEDWHDAEERQHGDNVQHAALIASQQAHGAAAAAALLGGSGTSGGEAVAVAAERVWVDEATSEGLVGALEAVAGPLHMAAGQALGALGGTGTLGLAVQHVAQQQQQWGSGGPAVQLTAAEGAMSARTSMEQGSGGDERVVRVVHMTGGTCWQLAATAAAMAEGEAAAPQLLGVQQERQGGECGGGVTTLAIDVDVAAVLASAGGSKEHGAGAARVGSVNSLAETGTGPQLRGGEAPQVVGVTVYVNGQPVQLQLRLHLGAGATPGAVATEDASRSR